MKSFSARDKSIAYNNGDFLKTVELLSEFDPVVKEHVHRVLKKTETTDRLQTAHCLGKNIQKKL